MSAEKDKFQQEITAKVDKSLSALHVFLPKLAVFLPHKPTNIPANLSLFHGNSPWWVRAMLHLDWNYSNNHINSLPWASLLKSWSTFLLTQITKNHLYKIFQNIKILFHLPKSDRKGPKKPDPHKWLNNQINCSIPYGKRFQEQFNCEAWDIWIPKPSCLY